MCLAKELSRLFGLARREECSVIWRKQEGQGQGIEDWKECVCGAWSPTFNPNRNGMRHQVLKVQNPSCIALVALLERCHPGSQNVPRIGLTIVGPVIPAQASSKRNVSQHATLFGVSSLEGPHPGAVEGPTLGKLGKLTFPSGCTVSDSI